MFEFRWLVDKSFFILQRLFFLGFLTWLVRTWWANYLLFDILRLIHLFMHILNRCLVTLHGTI